MNVKAWDSKHHMRRAREYAGEHFALATMFNPGGNLEFGFLKAAAVKALDDLERIRPIGPAMVLDELLSAAGFTRDDLNDWSVSYEHIRYWGSEGGIPGVGYLGKPWKLAYRTTWFDLDDEQQTKMFTNLDSLPLDPSAEDLNWSMDRAVMTVDAISKRGGFFKMNGKEWDWRIDGKRALRGLQRQYFLTDWLKWRFPGVVIEPSEDNGPCPFDFIVRIPGRSIYVDAASTLGTRFGHKRPTDLHMLIRFDDDEKPRQVYWDSTLTGKQFKAGVGQHDGQSPVRTIVKWNMIIDGMHYDEFVAAAREGYQREAKGANPNRQKRRPREGEVPLFDYKNDEEE